MIKKNHTKSRGQTATISFPARFRVRCPRCSCDRHPQHHTGGPVRYLCGSTDESQSAACIDRAKIKSAEKLVAEAREILGNLDFRPSVRELPRHLNLVN